MKGVPITEELYRYIVDHFAPEDALLRDMPDDADKQGVPMIHISPEQGKFLQVLMKAVGARKRVGFECSTLRSGGRRSRVSTRS